MKQHKIRIYVVILCLSLLLMGAAVFSQQASADQILVDAPNGGYYYYGMYSPDGLAASFTLTDSEYISTIGVVLHTPSNASVNTFNFSLQDSLTGPFTTFVSAALTTPLGSVSTQIIDVNKTLPAGTYYLIGIVPGYYGTPVTPGDVDGWMLSTGVYNNAAGTVTDGVWAFNGYTWSLLSGNYYNNGTMYYAPAFSVNGLPESSTITFSSFQPSPNSTIHQELDPFGFLSIAGWTNAIDSWIRGNSTKNLNTFQSALARLNLQPIIHSVSLCSKGSAIDWNSVRVFMNNTDVTSEAGLYPWPSNASCDSAGVVVIQKYWINENVDVKVEATTADGSSGTGEWTFSVETSWLWATTKSTVKDIILKKLNPLVDALEALFLPTPVLSP